MATSLGKLKQCSGTSFHKPCLQSVLDVRHRPSATQSNLRSLTLDSRLYHRHSIEHRLACSTTPASSDPGQPELPNIDPLSTKNQDAGATYSLQNTKALVETAMLAAVSGLAFVLATILRLDNTIGYFLPLPIMLAAMRSGPASGWGTMAATGFLLVVLLGPLKAMSYVLMHGGLAATMGSLWHAKTNWWLSVLVLAVVRMAGQMSYLIMSSVTMNENLFALMLTNVYSMLDQVFAALGSSGAPSTTTVICMIFGLLFVNGTCYSVILHMIYRIMLQAMGFAKMLGPMPDFIRKFLYPNGNDPSGAQRAAA